MEWRHGCGNGKDLPFARRRPVCSWSRLRARATPARVAVAAGESLWTIAERSEGSLFATACEPADEQQRMSSEQGIDVELNEILQLNRNPGELSGRDRARPQATVG
nr:LWXIA domain-containing protein [Burkholderia sp. BCC1644]